jgi:hypothetical protein
LFSSAEACSHQQKLFLISRSLFSSAEACSHQQKLFLISRSFFSSAEACSHQQKLLTISRSFFSSEEAFSHQQKLFLISRSFFSSAKACSHQQKVVLIKKSFFSSSKYYLRQQKLVSISFLPRQIQVIPISQIRLSTFPHISNYKCRYLSLPIHPLTLAFPPTIFFFNFNQFPLSISSAHAEREFRQFSLTFPLDCFDLKFNNPSM